MPEALVGRVKLYAYEMRQDDPRKCSAHKLCRLGLVTSISRAAHIPRRAVVLNPTVDEIFYPGVKPLLHGGLLVVDCSWKRADEVFVRRFRGIQMRLPRLLAANPINYGHVSVLSSAEAFSAGLYITGFKEQAEKIVSVFKWGPVFLSLNQNPLNEYSEASTREEVRRLEEEFFPSV